MKAISLLSASLLLVGSVQAGGQESRGTKLRLPATRSPVVADAAMRGDLAQVRSLLAKGEDVNAAQGDGMTALHWAADRGDSALTAALLRAHANVRAVTRVGAYTPLDIASKAGSAPVVIALLKAGSDPNALTTDGATALHLAATAGNPVAVAALLDHGANVNAREPEWGQTPLIFASEANRAEAIRVLLKHGADPAIHTTALNLTDQAAKEQAATRKRNEVLISFEPEKHKNDSVEAAAARAAADAQAGGGRPGRGGGGPQPKGPFTAAQIQAAIDSGRAVLTHPLIPKGPVTEEVDTINGGIVGFVGSVGGVGGLTALHHAVRQGSVDAALALIDGGANINDTSLVDHTTPLLMATINGQFDVAIRLIQRHADPNIASTAGMTPLYATINTEWAPRSRYPQPQAVQNQKTSYMEVVEALLKAGANPNVRIIQQPWYFAYNNCGNANCGLENIEGTTAFWRATYAVDVDAMRMLVKYGADPTIPSLRAPPAAGGGRGGRGGRGGGRGVIAPPDSAAGGGQFARGGGGGGGRGGPPQPPLEPAIDSAAKAVPPGIGVFPIHAAAGVGYGNGYAGNAHRHAPDGWMPAMRYLVEELHADVNARDVNGFTPLHHAAARGDNEMILYLVSKGADVKAVSRRGQTTVDMANGPVSRISPIPSTIALLEKLGAHNSHRCASC